MLFIFGPVAKAFSEKSIFVRNIDLMKITGFIAIAAALCFAIISFGCGGGATNTTTTKPANASNTANTTTTTSSTTTTTAPANTETAKADSTEPATGVPECDEYIKKFEACLTTIGAKAPQAAPGLKAGFDAQRNGFKVAASTPQGKTILAGQCKTYIEEAKTRTAQWCTNW
jgi:hypothetical protein